MIEFEKALAQHCQQASTLKTLTGGRIYAAVLPQGAVFPCIRYNIVAGTDEATHSGADGQKSRRVQFSIFAETYDEVVNIDRALHSRFQALSGAFGDASADLHGAFFQNTFDQWEDDAKLFHRATDYLFLFNN